MKTLIPFGWGLVTGSFAGMLALNAQKTILSNEYAEKLVATADHLKEVYDKGLEELRVKTDQELDAFQKKIQKRMDSEWKAVRKQPIPLEVTDGGCGGPESKMPPVNPNP